MNKKMKIMIQTGLSRFVLIGIVVVVVDDGDM
jgi:hypothetical protein